MQITSFRPKPYNLDPKEPTSFRVAFSDFLVLTLHDLAFVS